MTSQQELQGRLDADAWRQGRWGLGSEPQPEPFS